MWLDRKGKREGKRERERERESMRKERVKNIRAKERRVSDYTVVQAMSINLEGFFLFPSVMSLDGNMSR